MKKTFREKASKSLSIHYISIHGFVEEINEKKGRIASSLAYLLGYEGIIVTSKVDKGSTFSFTFNDEGTQGPTAELGIYQQRREIHA